MAGNNIVNMTIKANMDISQMSSSISQMQGILQKLKLPDDMRKQFSSLFSTATADLEKYQSKLQSGFKTKGDVTGLEKIGRGLEATFSSIEKEWSKLQGLDISKLVTLDPSSQARVKEIENSFKTLGAELKSQVAPNLQNITTLINQLSTKSSKKGGAQITELLGAGQYEQAIALLDQLILKQQKAVASFDKGDKNAGVRGQTLQQYEAIRQALDQVIPKIQEYNNQANNLQSEKIQIFANATQQANGMLQQGVDIAANATNQMRNYGNAAQHAAQQTQQLGYDLDMIKSRIQYFFSLTNGAMLFRRVLQDTIQTTKELDAAMTETAVVTEFDVSDMWKELPRYTEEAKKLGATIQGVYETMTLYYQQGLKTNEVFEVGRETLKMARIAGLDYAKATDFMTAALRGFNMEVNEINAQKINDVYSNLAAITAADTQEIATAMTKTASIASNANMEFETTAAFLSQIIETTRESAETAGTAMKTVIARFTELKKDPAEIGEVDGEIVDANKIETALRTIDVALRDTSGQFRDLDDVFLDIAAKWDGLDTNTQRYIATMAAGSRQQSRFIAMMSDYGRTMELVNAANNSAGASQKQFDKTLESLEAKLNQLKDAWDQFTMGIANNTLIKAGVDAITGLLNIVNKLTEHLPGATKGIANLLLMIGGFTAGKKVMDAFFASTVSNIANLGKVGSAAGAAYGTSFGSALATEFGKTGKTISKIFSKKTWINSGDLFSNSFKAVDKELSDIANNAANLFYSVEEGFDDTLEASAYNKALADRNMLMKAATKDQQTYIALRQAGLPIETAQLALKKELTEEDWEELAIQSLLIGTDKTRDGLTKAEILNRKALLKAKQAELAIDKMGLLTKAKYVALLFLGNPAQKAEARERLVAAGSTWAQKIALDGLNLSLGANIALLILGIALIAGLVIGLVKLAKWSKEQTLEYKMEKAAEATEKAKQAAESARQAYDDLNSSIEEIGTAEKELENLTYGTLEWQKALLEVNQQIMDLINRFPDLRDQLLDELQIDRFGKLSLSVEGYDLIKQKGLQHYQNTVAGQSVSATYQDFLQKQQAEHQWTATNFYIQAVDESGQAIMKKTVVRVGNFFGNLIAALGAGMAGAPVSAEETLNWHESWADPRVTRTATKEEKEEIYNKYLEDPEIFIEGNSELEGFAAKLGLASDGILNFVPAIRALRKAELEYEAQLRAQSKQILLAATSDDFRARDDSANFADSVATIFDDKKLLEVETQADFLLNIDSTNATALGEKYGITGFTDKGDTLLTLQSLYRELTGATPEEVEERFGKSETELAKAIAQIDVGTEWGKTVEQLYNDFKDFNQEYYKGSTSKIEQQALNDLFSGGDGQGFTLDTLDQLISKEAQQALWNSSPEGLQKMFSNFDEFGVWIAEQRKLAKEQYNYAASELTTFGVIFGTTVEEKNTQLKELFGENISVNSLKGLTDKYLEVFKSFGKEEADAFAETMKGITENLPEEEAKKFLSAVNGIDWSNREQVLNFSENLTALGIDLQSIGVNVDDLEQDFIKLGKATTKIQLENLTETIQELGQLSIQIQTKEKEGRGFSKEEKELLLKTGVAQEKDFSFNVETSDYTYLGESTDRIVAAIKEQTSELLGSEDYEQQLVSGHVIEQLRDERLSTETFEDKAAFIQRYNNEMGIKRDKDGNIILDEEGKQIAVDSPYSQDLINKLVSGAANDSAIQAEIDKIYNEIMQHYLGLSNNEAKWLEAQQQGGIANIQTNSSSADILDELSKLRGTNIEGITDTQIVDNKSLNSAEIDKYTTALTNQAEAAGVSQQKLDAYRTKLAELNNATDPSEIKDLTTEVENLEKELANTIGFNKTNKAMQTSVERTIELLDGYEDLYDEASKIEQVQKMVDNFELGDEIKVDTSNYQTIYDYMLGIAQGSYEAYQGLMNLAMTEFGVTVNGNGYFDGLTDAIITTDSLFGQMIQNMIENGAFVEETVTISEAQDYVGALVKTVNDDGTFSYEPVTKTKHLNKTVTIVRPKNANEIKTISHRGGGSNNKWENPYDSFYNINSDINDVLEKRNLLEKEYDLLLQNENASIDDYIKSYEQRIGSYKEEIALAKEALRMREQERTSLLSENSDLSKYAWIDENGEVKINYELISKVTNEEEGERIEKYIDRLETNAEETDKLNETIADNTLAIENLIDEWRQTTADFEKEVFDALVWEREQQIEQYESVADSIETANNDLVSAIQNTIDERRQKRDNEETEQELSDKERRLAYLQQDTSGANEQEILQLQKEIKEGKQDYTDTLIDQKISELEKQNEEAAKQREKQIQLMQYQLENDKNTGVIANQVHQLLKNATSDEGWNNVWKLLENSAGFKGLTQTEQQVWIEETQRNFKEAMAYLGSGGLVEDLSNINVQNINNYNYSGNDTIETGTGNGSGGSSGGGSSGGGLKTGYSTYNRIEEDSSGKKYYQIGNVWYKEDQISNVDTTNKGVKLKTGAKSTPKIMAKIGTLDKTWLVAEGTSEKEAEIKAQQFMKEHYGFKQWNGVNYYKGSDGYWYHHKDVQFLYKGGHGEYFGGVKAYAPKYKYYKTGGLADFTGPAWLDGTKSRPELVLNQRDTQNFLQLKDVLASFMKNGTTVSNTSTGNTNYEISINVEKMTSDYDVEQVAQKIKQIIVTDATYRNSNIINRLR